MVHISFKTNGFLSDIHIISILTMLNLFDHINDLIYNLTIIDLTYK